MFRRILTGILLAATAGLSQITGEQRFFDLQYLANLFARRYAPYEWKRDKLGFDHYNTAPWIERMRRAADDMEVLEILSEYVASLQDTHAQFRISSTFSVNAPLAADIYDGRVLIDALNRTVLPVAQFPIQAGDEILSIDGQPAMEVVKELSKPLGWANPRARLRNAAGFLFSRPQALYPRVFTAGPAVRIEVAHQAGGTGIYDIPWTRNGSPITRIGPVPGPRTAAEEQSFLRRYHAREIGDERSRVLGLGARNPYFRLPPGFQTRLGSQAAHFHYSGTYSAGGRRIGYLRIRNFSPPSESAAFTELSQEIAFLEENTDGLVVDVTRNTGGGCYGLAALQLLIPYPFKLPADEVRATLEILQAVDVDLILARQANAPPGEIAQLENLFAQIRSALDENRGRTGPLPFCAASFDHFPAMARDGRILAYSKPLIVLTDEFTISWGDTFAAAMQDNGRGPLFGYRTNGAGGASSLYPAGFYSESLTTLSITLGVRHRTIATEDFGETNVLENTGVRPDIPYDYMTRDNLLNAGAPFVEAFTAAILAEIEKAGK